MTQQPSMTAMISAFARAYHHEVNSTPIFRDSCAKALLGQDYARIAENMASGISFFCPSFSGTQDQALRWITDTYLSPSPLGRAAFAEDSLHSAAVSGMTQYLILAAGYDTFAYRRPDWADSLSVWEVDHPLTAQHKQQLLRQAGIAIPEHTYYVSADLTDTNWNRALQTESHFSSALPSFCSILGLFYYCSHSAVSAILSGLSSLLLSGSQLVFDYPDENAYTKQAGERTQIQSLLANGADEPMLSCYSYEKMEQLLADFGFSVHRHLTPDQITQEYFSAYNTANPEHRITALSNVNYCLAIKR